VLARINGTRVGSELIANLPDQLYVAPARFLDLTGNWMSPKLGEVWHPSNIDPNNLTIEQVAIFAHELVHIVQREVGRTDMSPFHSTQYAEVEAYIIQYAIQYELAGGIGSSANEAQNQLANFTKPWQDSRQWLLQRDASYGGIFYSEGIHGTGNWRDTLPELGFSATTVQFIDSIP